MQATQSNDFYRTLAPLYDQFFPVEKSTIDFLTNNGALPGARVLDLACGSGLYTQALVDRKADAHGVDSSAELIEIARQRSGDPDRFTVGDILDTESYQSGNWDLIFCIGNSIAHLPDIQSVLSFVDLLTQGAPTGIVLQFVEMQSIQVGEERALPTLKAQGSEFHRQYVRHRESSMTFVGTLVSEDQASITIENELLVIDTEQVTRRLRNCGYMNIDMTGGFDGESDSDSWVRVIRAIRSE